MSTALKDTSRTLSASRTLLGRSLLVVQIAISLVLLVGAGLFLRTVDNLQRVDVGFNPDNLVLAGVDPQLSGYDSGRATALYARLTQWLQAVPGVRGVTWSNPMLLAGGVNSTRLYRPGDLREEGADRDIHRLRIAPNFFEVMEIPLVAGRALGERDGDGAPRVALLNEAGVRKFFGDVNPLGQRFGSRPEDATAIEVVGVVRDARYDELRGEPPPTMYVPFTQYGVASMFMGIRTAGDPAAAIGAVREAVRQVDRNLPLMRVTTQTGEIDRRLAQERLFAQAGMLFGWLALLVASIGLFGLMSYSVAWRTNEIGIRMALGAGRLIASQLLGVTPLDVPTLAGAVLVMLAVSAAAGY